MVVQVRKRVRMALVVSHPTDPETAVLTCGDEFKLIGK